VIYFAALCPKRSRGRGIDRDADLTLDVRMLLQGLLLPMLRRLRRAEGVLLAINASIILTHEASPRRMAMQLLVSAVVLALLYAYNDVYDCEADVENPKKDRRLVLLLIAHRARIIRALVVLSAAAIVVSYLALGMASAVAVASVLSINVVYSHVLKRTAVIDVLWVGLCGGAYVLTPGIPLDFRVVLLVAVMTGASHVFQTLGDRSVDRLNRVQTTAVVSPRLASALLVAFCAVAAWVVGHYFGPVLALTAFLPFAAHLAIDDAERAWLLSKVYFGVLWLALILLSDARVL
jgi:4-hydroxybenzoate polyprenyltransferase